MTDTMDRETAERVRRGVLAFREMPVLIDASLIRAVLDDPRTRNTNP